MIWIMWELSLILILRIISQGNEIKFSSGEITLVSSFFNIGRSINESKYLRNFKRWGRLKNDLIMFCDDENLKVEILRIRKSFGLGSRTSVRIIENVTLLERRIFEKMIDISEDEHFLNFRGKKNVRENSYQFNYIVNLKCYFLQKASTEYGVRTSNIGWIDFGFDKRRLYTHKKDWAFTLACELSDKITFFYKHRVDKRPMFEIVRTVEPTCIMSGFFVCPRNLVDHLWNLAKESLDTFFSVGFMDDDETILLHCTRIHSEIFRFKDSFWALALKEYCNGKHMRLNEKERKHFPKKKL